MTVRVAASVDVSAPPEAVFAAMIDLPSQDRWILATRLYPLGGDVPIPEVGSQMAALTGVRGLGVLDTMEVTTYDPPRLWVTTHTGGTVQGRGIFQVDPVGSGSVVTWAEELELPLGILGRIGWPVISPLVRWALHRSLLRLARGVLDGSLPVTGGAGAKAA